MSEKNKKSNGEQQKEESKKKESGGNVTVVLKTDLHCEGCTSKILKCIRSFDGVDTADIGNGQITVVGKMDPAKLRERVEKKTHKKVEVVLPKAKKGDDKDKDKDKDKAKNSEKKKEENAEKKKEPPQGKNATNKSDEKKSKDKEPSVATTQLKMLLHCDGCIQKIRKIVVKTKGYRDMNIDKQKDIVTVTGVVDMKALAEALRKQLKREVQIVPAKKEAAQKKEGEKAKGGGDKGKSGGGDGGGKAGGVQVQVLNQHPYPYPYPIVYESGQFHYNPYAYGPSHAPQLFSDENPNACSLM
ncbi:heavy metal-associated isoprenylated plant protein 3-like [Salvia divinorum]|uniref:Heavy metal-associated isoprenylated plant protein 3-like n=1 Tax=Salvia divinorum TaxID=28513 RepID=A0ABD1H6T8_SALDI